jgi:hypothetical protein
MQTNWQYWKVHFASGIFTVGEPWAAAGAPSCGRWWGPADQEEARKVLGWVMTAWSQTLATTPSSAMSITPLRAGDRLYFLLGDSGARELGGPWPSNADRHDYGQWKGPEDVIEAYMLFYNIQDQEEPVHSRHTSLCRMRNMWDAWTTGQIWTTIL